MQIYIIKDQQQTGPFHKDHIETMLTAGFITKDIQAWHEGLDSWKPLHEVLNALNAAPAQQTPQQNSIPIPIPISVTQEKTRDNTNYSIGRSKAQFSLRACAHIIDCLIFIPSDLIFKFIFHLDPIQSAIINLLLAITYYIVMETSDRMATLGKIALGLIVVNEKGSKLTPAESFIRYLSKILSGLTIIGYLLPLFTSDKKALHDKISKTQVLLK